MNGCDRLNRSALTLCAVYKEGTVPRGSERPKVALVAVGAVCLAYQIG